MFRSFIQCVLFWPEDGRPYVALGKLLCKQSKFSEARSVYERGCQATQGENPYIWQVCGHFSFIQFKILPIIFPVKLFC